MEFQAHVNAVRSTPDKTGTTTRITLEAHDIATDWLVDHMGYEIEVRIIELPPIGP